MKADKLKNCVQHTLIQWEQQKPELERVYREREEKRMDLLQPAIDQLKSLIESSGLVENSYTGKKHFTLAPNNYEERIEFIQQQHTSHYSLIQLTMLYDEVKKKAARLRVQQ
ncbi:hypothetical protein DV702_03610 [Sporosarcina sp. PTS2304]|uniref:YpoC family protein n=1 Tax=Sporosarcina sp. PTS2304 TaxID=2283194 RepID=UPI000E0D9D93|nr:hypothetical protein [Sporosarcina sp. PTS2304]AXH98893.1 hypothetical protein DV702_03610 [Sporosarcina sp. PTS2304]